MNYKLTPQVSTRVPLGSGQVLPISRSLSWRFPFLVTDNLWCGVRPLRDWVGPRKKPRFTAEAAYGAIRPRVFLESALTHNHKVASATVTMKPFRRWPKPSRGREPVSVTGYHPKISRQQGPRHPVVPALSGDTSLVGCSTGSLIGHHLPLSVYPDWGASPSSGLALSVT